MENRSVSGSRAGPGGGRRAFAIVGAASALAVGAGLAYGLLWPGGPAIDPDDPAQVALGEQVYAEQCARCHGVNLEGQANWRERQANGRLPAPPHDASGHTWHHPDAVLFGMTRHGLGPYAPAGYQSDMPTFEGVLTDEEIAAVLAFIKSRWPADVRARQQRIDRQGEQQ